MSGAPDRPVTSDEATKNGVQPDQQAKKLQTDCKREAAVRAAAWHTPFIAKFKLGCLSAAPTVSRPVTQPEKLSNNCESQPMPQEETITQAAMPQEETTTQSAEISQPGGFEMVSAANITGLSLGQRRDLDVVWRHIECKSEHALAEELVPATCDEAVAAAASVGAEHSNEFLSIDLEGPPSAAVSERANSQSPVVAETALVEETSSQSPAVAEPALTEGANSQSLEKANSESTAVAETALAEETNSQSPVVAEPALAERANSQSLEKANSESTAVAETALAEETNLQSPAVAEPALVAGASSQSPAVAGAAVATNPRPPQPPENPMSPQPTPKPMPPQPPTLPTKPRSTSRSRHRTPRDVPHCSVPTRSAPKPSPPLPMPTCTPTQSPSVPPMPPLQPRAQATSIRIGPPPPPPKRFDPIDHSPPPVDPPPLAAPTVLPHDMPAATVSSSGSHDDNVLEPPTLGVDLSDVAVHADKTGKTDDPPVNSAFYNSYDDERPAPAKRNEKGTNGNLGI